MGETQLDSWDNESMYEVGCYDLQFEFDEFVDTFFFGQLYLIVRVCPRGEIGDIGIQCEFVIAPPKRPHLISPITDIHC